MHRTNPNNWQHGERFYAALLLQSAACARRYLCRIIGE